MSKKLWIIIILIVALLTALFFYLKTDDKFVWDENYRYNNHEPYGEHIIYKMMQNYFDNDSFVRVIDKLSNYIKKDNDSVTNANYIFIGDALFLDSASKEDLLQFVHNGNNAFISARQLPYELRYSLYDYQCGYGFDGFSYNDDTIIQAQLFHPSLELDTLPQYKFKRKDVTYRYWWSYINDSYLCKKSKTFTKLGYYKSLSDTQYVNFVRVDYGKGHIYFHTTPLMFTNYFMINETSLNYASGVLSHLPKGKIYWDEYNKIPHYFNNNEKREGMHNIHDGPLQYLLSFKSMRWAWYILLLMVFVYILFRAKRRQKAIPLIIPNNNTSLEFVQTMGRLYFLQNDHKNLCQLKMKQFLTFIRNKYHIPTSNINAELIKKIAQKAQIPFNVIDGIFGQYNLIVNSSATIEDVELIKYHQSIDNFYKNCK